MELIIIDIKKNKIDIESTYKTLPIDIQKRVDRYKIEEDRKRSIIAWDIVNKKIDLNNNKISYNKNNKPLIENKYFSISHSYNLVGVLFADFECGLDIELVTERNNKVADKILTQEELEEYNNNSDILIKKWTKIEAYGKGIGIGFRLDLTKDLPENIITKEITDSLDNKYYYSIWINEK
jgi:phosphopantetheinyl transferase